MLPRGEGQTEWRRTGHAELFMDYVRYAEQVDNAVLPTIFAARFPLGSTRYDGKRNGFIVHDRMIRMFTAAIPVLFSREFRTRNADQSLEICPATFCKKPGQEDPYLDRTFGFVAVGVATDVHKKSYVEGTNFNTIGVRCDAIFDQAPFRFMSCQRISEDLFRAEKQLLQYDRPFVSLGAFTLIDPQIMEDIRKGLGVSDDTAPPPEEYKRFILYFYADVPVLKIVEHTRAMCERFRPTRPVTGITIRPYCFSVAVILHV